MYLKRNNFELNFTSLSHFRELRNHGQTDAVDAGLVGAEVHCESVKRKKK
jgi:hypothetical protein